MSASITVRAEWCMGHRLPNHEGYCRRLHGHQYTVEATVEGAIKLTKGAPDEGMVVDFGEVKTRLKSIASSLDHQFLLSAEDPFVDIMKSLPGVIVVNFVPTAENIALMFLLDLPTDVTSVRVWETPTSYAEVRR